MLQNVRGTGSPIKTKFLGIRRREAEKKSSSVSKDVAGRKQITNQLNVKDDVKTDKLSLSSVASKRRRKRKCLLLRIKLSDKAKDYLAKLRKSRKNVDFRISGKRHGKQLFG